MPGVLTWQQRNSTQAAFFIHLSIRRIKFPVLHILFFDKIFNLSNCCSRINSNLHAPTSGCTTINKSLLGAFGIPELLYPSPDFEENSSGTQRNFPDFPFPPASGLRCGYALSPGKFSVSLVFTCGIFLSVSGLPFGISYSSLMAACTALSRAIFCVFVGAGNDSFQFGMPARCRRHC